MATTRLGLHGGPRAALAVAGVNALLAVSVESASEVSNPVVAQVHVLTAVSVESASEVSAPAVGGQDDAVHPPGTGSQAVHRRKIIREDEEIFAVITAWLQIKDD